MEIYLSVIFGLKVCYKKKNPAKLSLKEEKCNTILSLILYPYHTARVKLRTFAPRKPLFWTRIAFWLIWIRRPIISYAYPHMIISTVLKMQWKCVLVRTNVEFFSERVIFTWQIIPFWDRLDVCYSNMIKFYPEIEQERSE